MRIAHFLQAFLVFSLILIPDGNALSEESGKSLNAHEHGHGELMIAQEEQELVIELHLPGADVVGFEHHPQTHEQEHAVEEAVKRLKETTQWLHLTEAADCRIEDMNVSSPLASSSDDHKNEHDDHNGGHDDEHAEEAHAEFRAEYHVHCEAPAELKGLNFTLFKVFSSLKEINFQALMQSGQFGGKLDQENSSMRF